jgi:hypothetical protein
MLLSMFLTVVSAGKARAFTFETLVPYNIFLASGQIDPTKVVCSEGRHDLGLEVNRGNNNGQLQLKTRSVGINASDTGRSSNFNFCSHPNPEEVNEMKAAITVTASSDPACASNSALTESDAVIIGSWFNTTNDPTPGSQMNDVVAGIGIDRTSASTPHVVAFVIQCMDPECHADTSTFLFSHDFGTATVGTPVNVTIKWDFVDHQLLFMKGSTTSTFSYDPLVLPDSSSPGLPFKGWEVFNHVPSCMTAPAKPVANISALFGNVKVNSSAAQ